MNSIVKLFKSKDKYRILKTARQKRHFTYVGKDFSYKQKDSGTTSLKY